ncbi:MAG: hypothetical protein ACHP9T_04920 [Caulobacterales bacterium]|jgi:uncharacterized membrane protein
MRRFIVLSALALCACGGDKNPSAPPRDSDLASNFSHPIDARGADPDWGLKIRGLQLTLDRPNQPDLVGQAPGAVIEPHEASWTAALPNGQAMKVSVYASPCTDNATGAAYPFAVEVLLAGATPLNGCGAPISSPRAPPKR